MYTFGIIFIGLALSFGAINFFADDGFLPGFFMGAFIGLFAGAIIAGSAIEPDTEKIFIGEVSIESVQDLNSIESTTFFLGCGSINDQMYYTFYYTTEDGGYKLGKIKVDDATIFYIEENPKVEEYKFVRIKSKHNNWSLKSAPCEPYYKIYVPKGTIKQNFTLDAN